MRNLLLVLAAALLVIAVDMLATSPCPPSNGDLAVVKHVIDGDTVVLMSGAKVRYIGIDTPEGGGEVSFRRLHGVADMSKLARRIWRSRSDQTDWSCCQPIHQ